MPVAVVLPGLPAQGLTGPANEAGQVWREVSPGAFTFCGQFTAKAGHVSLFLTVPLVMPVAGVAIYGLARASGNASEGEPALLGSLSNASPSQIFPVPAGTDGLGMRLLTAEDMQNLPETPDSGAPTIARRLLDHLFNYVTSFLPSAKADVAIPMRVFGEWHAALQRKLAADPSMFSRQ